jgi:nicotinate phosphoribosyltransferase
MIIRSLLDVDWYKLTMAQFAWKMRPDAQVTYGFVNRSVNVPLAKKVDEQELQSALNRIGVLRFADQDIAWLRESRHVERGFFSEEFLLFLCGMQLPPCTVTTHGEQLRIETTGSWPTAIFWETIILSVVNEIYFRSLVPHPDVWAMDRQKGDKALDMKIEMLKKHPTIRIADFGTRRRFSRSWHRHVVRRLAQELPEQFIGTSNAFFARQFGLRPVGTFAHELFMVYAALAETDKDVEASHNRVLDDWYAMYGDSFAIALTDTYGRDYFFRTFGRERAVAWRGLRHDSGDPFSFGDQALAFYESCGLDPAKKTVMYSDGLDLEMIGMLHRRFHGLIGLTFGWGTNLTNDLGFKPLSMVVKAISVNGRPTVKLSDTLAKTQGTRDDIDRYQRIFGYVPPEDRPRQW